jgi:two-component system sensor histidine kinase/response regulator
MTQAHETDLPEKTHILLVDDDRITHIVIKKMLEGAGYAVDLAGNGREAISALELNTYDLVLMDCLMPDMDGFEATRFIRDSESVQIDPETPVIALTGLTGGDDLARCFDAGMNAFVAKPVVLDALLVAIKQCLGKPEYEEPALQKNHLQKEQDREEGFMDGVIEKFIGDIPQTISSLKLAVKSSDVTELQNIGHRLRGVAGILNLAKLSTRSGALERAGQSGQSRLACGLALELIRELQILSDDR